MTFTYTVVTDRCMAYCVCMCLLITCKKYIYVHFCAHRCVVLHFCDVRVCTCRHVCAVCCVGFSVRCKGQAARSPEQRSWRFKVRDQVFVPMKDYECATSHGSFKVLLGVLWGPLCVLSSRVFSGLQPVIKGCCWFAPGLLSVRLGGEHESGIQKRAA